jgi:hypothetical protein
MRSLSGRDKPPVPRLGLGDAGAVWAGPVHYSDAADVDRFLDALARIAGTAPPARISISHVPSFQPSTPLDMSDQPGSRSSSRSRTALGGRDTHQRARRGSLDGYPSHRNREESPLPPCIEWSSVTESGNGQVHETWRKGRCGGR